ncbi:hypothetical protein DPSP01_012911 [Paraphaeosphaeria sporulosa]
MAHVVGMVYAWGIMEQAGVVASWRQQFRASSEDWHWFLGFPGDRGRKWKRAPFETGKMATFRSVQKEAIQAIIGGESPVMAVMPTGVGKSILFMLPAWAE